MQKSTMSKEELKHVCNLLLSEDSLTEEPNFFSFAYKQFNF